MNSLAIDIKNKLLALGIGSATPATDWSIHANAYPEKPARIIAIYTAGNVHTHIMGTRITKETPTFQIRVRGVSPTEAELKIDAIHNALERIGTFTVTPISPNTEVALYLDVLVTTGPFPMGRDGNDWFSWVINFKTFREVYAPTP